MQAKMQEKYLKKLECRLPNLHAKIRLLQTNNGLLRAVKVILRTLNNRGTSWNGCFWFKNIFKFKGYGRLHVS